MFQTMVSATRFDLNLQHVPLNFRVPEVLNIVNGDWVRKYGSIYRIWFIIRPVILITSPELLDVKSFL